MMMRTLSRILLLAALVMAGAVIVISTGWPTLFRVDALNAVAAALAVITAGLSAWSAQRLIEREEDAQRPQLYLYFDVSSRYHLAQLVLRNFGGSPAFDVCIEWVEPLLDSEGNQVSFTGRTDGLAAPVLVQKESIAAYVDALHSLVTRPDLLFAGHISYAVSPGGKKLRQAFLLSAEKYRQALLYSDEAPATLHELQKVPDELMKVRGALERVAGVLATQADLDNRQIRCCPLAGMTPDAADDC